MTGIREWTLTTAWLLLPIFLLTGGTAVAAATEEPGRIVAVGDVHGSLEGLTEILREAELIDDSGCWTGGAATLVQVGDLLDRGVQVCEVMDLLMRLQREAPKAGGEVVCLLGNHEGMNLLGLVRDVNPEVYAAFADAKSETRRKKAFTKMKRSREKRTDLFATSPGDEGAESREEWMARRPVGFLEYHEAIGPDGVYGAWLRSLPVAARRGNSLFVHGGISPILQGLELAAVNERVASELRHFDHYRKVLAKKGLAPPTASVIEVKEIALAVEEALPLDQGKRARQLRSLADDLKGATGFGGWFLTHPDGPLWYRGAALGEPEEGAESVAAILDFLKVRRMVIGHTVMRNGNIKSRYGGRVLAIDTGMLAEFYEGGRPAAIEIVGDKITAIYPGERIGLVNGEWQRTVDAVEE